VKYAAVNEAGVRLSAKTAKTLVVLTEMPFFSATFDIDRNRTCLLDKKVLPDILLNISTVRNLALKDGTQIQYPWLLRSGDSEYFSS
jgi:hypothetical protein